MDSDRKVRALRTKIPELSEKFDKKFKSVLKLDKYKKVKGIGFSIGDTGVEGAEEFYKRISSYGVDLKDDDELKKMSTSLKNVENLLGMKLKDIRRTRKKSDFEEIAYEVQTAISNSVMMQRLPADELERRLEKIKYNPNISRREYIRNLKNEIEQLQFEQDAARVMMVVNSHKGLTAMYEGLVTMNQLLNDELDYRVEHEEVSLAYNSLCEVYQSLEKIFSRYDVPNISDKERAFLNQEMAKTIPVIYEYLSSDTREKVFSQEEGRRFNGKDIFKVLKEEIQDLAFEKNALNGIVDHDMARKDFCDIVQIDFLNNLEKAKTSQELKQLRKVNERTENAKEYADKLELKLLMQELVETYKKEAKLNDLKNKLNTLKNKPQEKLTDAEKTEMQKLSKEIVGVQLEVNRISQKVSRVRDLAGSLGVDCITDGSVNLNSINSINTIGLPAINSAIRAQRDSVEEKRTKLLTRYEVKGRLTPENIQKQMSAKIDKIESKRRYRIIDLEYEGENHEQNQNSENKKSIEKTTEDTVVIQKMKVHDTQMQLDTIDDRYKTRVECGKVYRYVRGDSDNELKFVQEDLETYIDNPKKKLNQVLDGIRDRLIEELGSEKELEAFCAENNNKEFLAGLVSKSPLKRSKAKRDFIKKLENANVGNEGMAYANMAIALNSEVLPESILEVMSRTAQPYVRDSDMKKYVKITEKRGLFGLGHREEGRIYQSRLLEADRRSKRAQMEREYSDLCVRSKSDGMVRPFKLRQDEMRFLPIQEPGPNNSTRKNKTKKREQNSQNIEYV